ncbi:alpha/beta fold hydrolase [Sphingomonas sp. CV7422]|uniref:alpha/beta fold hydrolase n=1 Tax=Sphingomonas sp. CV7422 TaxID=3018036 RepID=UPI0022FE59C4|nr:alpha/beta hydrolase [Sphingomonas sp. CV7422]
MIRPTLLMLHALGASGDEWRQVRERLPDYDCVALDLPGFGAAAGQGHADVVTMADQLADAIRASGAPACILVGHSMGGKMATLVAARAAAGEYGLSRLLGVVLVAASPPSPEPMDEARRAQMLGWCADGAIDRDAAETFVDANTAARLPDPLREAAIADVRRSAPEAWIAWLERGSREDWSADIGPIAMPALIVAGSDDGDLGEAAQRRLNQPLYEEAEVAVVADAAHLIPYEQPDALAALIDGFATGLAASVLPRAFADLLGSARVSRRTRAAMLARLRPPRPSDWSAAQHATIVALTGQILPDLADADDLARRVEASIGDGGGDGWRFDSLPPDRIAWVRGLATLDTVTGGFAALDRSVQADWLDRLAAGEVGCDDDGRHLSPAQMALWFEDVRAEVVRSWIALPATMAAIGYDGFAVGGDGPRKQGYVRTQADTVEAWQVQSETVA